jgi:hypothetical protein
MLPPWQHAIAAFARGSNGGLILTASAFGSNHPDLIIRGKAGQSIHDQGESRGEIVTWKAVEAHAILGLTRDDPEAVVFDFVDPLGADRRLWGPYG